MTDLAAVINSRWVQPDLAERVHRHSLIDRFHGRSHRGNDRRWHFIQIGQLSFSVHLLIVDRPLELFALVGCAATLRLAVRFVPRVSWIIAAVTIVQAWIAAVKDQ